MVSSKRCGRKICKGDCRRNRADQDISALFVPNSAVSEHVLNEVEMAYNKKRSASQLLIEPLCLEVLDLDAPEFDEIMYYIRRINFIAPSNLDSPKAIAQEIISKNKDFLKLENIHIKKRTKSAYFTSVRETARLQAWNFRPGC